MKKRGFTLIELILVIAIISIIISIAFIKGGFLESYKEKNETNILIENINYAREKAMATGYDYNVDLIENTILLRSNGVEEYIELKYLNFGRNKTKQFKFTSSGSVSGANTFIIYGNNNREYELKIAAASAYCRLVKK
ncbi:MAG: prepilin-type N-terminal cleavage/methylation domain-containing protein [Tissierellia bacterium]|nr:prepilin-type N-terminal cleavage/methylation domain-containing protein [Tissierellia bacterium]